MYKVLKILKSDFDKIFLHSGKRILKLVQVTTASYFRSGGVLPIKKKLTSRSGQLQRDLVSDKLTSENIGGNLVGNTKKLTNKNAHLLTDKDFAITPRQKALFRHFAATETNPIWRNFWGRLGNPRGARFLRGRGHIEKAFNRLGPSKLLPIITEEFDKVYPKLFEDVEL